jgi:hypothetical protein
MPFVAAGAAVALFALDVPVAAVVAFLAAAIAVRRVSIWLAVCTAAWAMVFLAVVIVPGPYDSPAGRAAVPVLAAYAALFLAGWAVARSVARTRCAGEVPAIVRTGVTWPDEPKLRRYVLVLLGLALCAAVVRFWGQPPPLFADNPDAARELLRQRENIVVGLLWEAWTVGLSISLFRLLTGGREGRGLYLTLVPVFAFGAALGASKNAALVGVVTALIASLSARRLRRHPSLSVRLFLAVVIIGVVSVGTAVFLGGQRTLAGSGAFETAFREQYGDNALATSVGSLDLSLSSSAETFGRLWVHREDYSPAWGRYSLIFLGSPGREVLGVSTETDLYGLTSALSAPYYMNTATFVAIPLLDYGRIGAGIFLCLLGLAVGFVESRLYWSGSPVLQLGLGFIVYYAAFGIYELYPLIQPFWLSTVTGLWYLHVIGRHSHA